jgi:type III secretion system YscQ/HrcQ family protein
VRLPRVKPEQVQSSAAIVSLPVETYSQIQSSLVSVLSRYSMNPPDQILISLVDLHELDFSSATDAYGSLGVFATFIADPNATSISFELGARFGAMLVDRVLGGDGVPPDHLRSLTKTERAVIEFLCLSAASELNAQVGEPLLRLRSLSDQPPWLASGPRIATATSGLPGAEWKRGLVASLRIGVGEISGIIRAYLNLGALAALDEAGRRLRTHKHPVATARGSDTVADKHPVATARGSDTVADKHPVATARGSDMVERYARVTPDVGLTVLVGKTDVTMTDLLGLEPGDVMAVDWPSLRWHRQRVSGSLLLRVSDADEALITADVSEIGDSKPLPDESRHGEPPQAGTIKVKVGAVAMAPPPRYAERLKMEEEAENDEPLAEGASLIEAVMLTVRVELAARRLRLDELSRLRVNQILDLGCKATDPVDLVVDGRRIARGELVDIEGRLGVRITQVLV